MANTLSVAIQTISTQSNPNPVTTPVGTVLASASLGAASALLGNLSRTSTNILGAMFPVSVVHIPVATICPAHTSISVSTLNNTSATLNSYNTTNQAFNATTRPPLLANTTSPTPTARLDDPNARIVLGDNGCQTLFSSTATAVCNTMISVGGQLPISVTDCGQWVTFSSSPICGPTPTGRGDATAYFLAPWLDIAGGAIPAEVQVRTCNGSSGCITGSESWTVDTKTASSTVVQVASFVGGAVGPLNLTLASGLYTTSVPHSNGSTISLSIHTTVTTISPIAVPTIIRLDLGAPTTTATVTLVTPVTTTYRVVAVTRHTTVTITVENTLTSVVTVAESTVEAIETGAT